MSYWTQEVNVNNRVDIFDRSIIITFRHDTCSYSIGYGGYNYLTSYYLQCDGISIRVVCEAINTGTSGVIYRCESDSTVPPTFALKVETVNSNRSACSESEISKSLREDESGLDTLFVRCIWADTTHNYYLMPLLDGDILQYYRWKTQLQWETQIQYTTPSSMQKFYEDVLLQILRQVAHKLVYMFKKGHIYVDLKRLNVMYQEKPEKIYIVDLGSMQEIKDNFGHPCFASTYPIPGYEHNNPGLPLRNGSNFTGDNIKKWIDWQLALLAAELLLHIPNHPDESVKEMRTWFMQLTYKTPPTEVKQNAIKLYHRLSDAVNQKEIKNCLQGLCLFIE